MKKRYCMRILFALLCLSARAERHNGNEYTACTVEEAYSRRADISTSPQYYVSYAHFDQLHYNSYMGWNQVIFYERVSQYCSFIDYGDFPAIKSGTVLKIYYRFEGSMDEGFDNYLDDFEITDRLFIQDTYYGAQDNLRIRSRGLVTGEIIGLLKKGEYAKVLEIGNEQTIDGITSEWVKIRTKDNKEGWCFGGYMGIRVE